MKETRKKYDMLTDNPGKSLLFFVLPMILGNLFQQFYNITDSVVVGKFVGEQALAAVGASYAITNVFIAIAIGGGIGSSVVISQFLGAGKLAKMKTAVFIFASFPAPRNWEITTELPIPPPMAMAIKTFVIA